MHGRSGRPSLSRVLGKANAEVDYVCVCGDEIIPIEVKAGGSGSMQSIRLFMAERNLANGIRTSLENFGVLQELDIVPLYAVGSRIFLINDWDGGDADNQNVAAELNRNSRIKRDVTILSDLPDRNPRKVDIDDLVTDVQVFADASRAGKIALAMGAHSRHALAWLTSLPRSAYDYYNIVLVTHSNWNELDGRRGYDANRIPGDPPLIDTHGESLRRGLYPNLARISDLGVKILEIPRTDFGPGGWGGRVTAADGGTTEVKALDISDLGLAHYLKTGIVEATRLQRNQFVSNSMKKPEILMR